MPRQIQAWCALCNRYTLHIQEVEEINHVGHALLTLFFCGCWWPIWLLATVFRRTYPYQCSVCGQVEGDEIAPHIREAQAERRAAALAKHRAAQFERRRGSLTGFVKAVA